MRLISEKTAKALTCHGIRVIFNTGMAGSLSEADIQMYMDMFRAAGCNPEQLAILEEEAKKMNPSCNPDKSYNVYVGEVK